MGFDYVDPRCRVDPGVFCTDLFDPFFTRLFEEKFQGHAGDVSPMVALPCAEQVRLTQRPSRVGGVPHLLPLVLAVGASVTDQEAIE